MTHMAQSMILCMTCDDNVEVPALDGVGIVIFDQRFDVLDV